ncbi:hypothetical protein M434DRAFT_18667 [Hypoxylon sp. CO27-5]|nr:hypothetical protein M434DRAFT_18667 [Hypoxylon sp. CO27-5]
MRGLPSLLPPCLRPLTSSRCVLRNIPFELLAPFLFVSIILLLKTLSRVRHVFFTKVNKSHYNSESETLNDVLPDHDADRRILGPLLSKYSMQRSRLVHSGSIFSWLASCCCQQMNASGHGSSDPLADSQPQSTKSWGYVYFLSPLQANVHQGVYVNTASQEDDGFVFITFVYAVILSWDMEPT